MRRKKRLPLHDYPARRIALIKPSALGDIVHSLPVLRALRQRYPRAHITWIINRSYAALIDGHPDLDATLCFDRGALRLGWRPAAAIFLHFLRQIRRRRFDLILDLQGLLRTGLMTWASGAARKVGLFTAREGARWAYTDVLAPGRLPSDVSSVHAVDRYWWVAEALGVGTVAKSFHLPVEEASRQWAMQRLQPWPRPWLMMHVGARWETKRWPLPHFVELAQRALRRCGGTVILVGGPEEVRRVQGVVAALEPSSVSLAGQTNLRQLVAVLAFADVVVSNDSGPLHIAAALGRPVVAPYTCTSPLRTGPYGARPGAVATQVWCAASYRKRCDRLDCMKELTPGRLWPALEMALFPWLRKTA
jgi:heptosyltransferase-1